MRVLRNHKVRTAREKQQKTLAALALLVMMAFPTWESHQPHDLALGGQTPAVQALGTVFLLEPEVNTPVPNITDAQSTNTMH